MSAQYQLHSFDWLRHVPSFYHFTDQQSLCENCLIIKSKYSIDFKEILYSPNLYCNLKAQSNRHKLYPFLAPSFFTFFFLSHLIAAYKHA